MDTAAVNQAEIKVYERSHVLFRYLLEMIVMHTVGR